MNIKTFEKIATGLFNKETLTFFNDGTQYGFNNYIEKEINNIGYSVNLTIDIIKQAKAAQVDLILTHHNIWEDHFELREDCLKALEEAEIIHFFNHLPLDSAPFGPSRTLAKDLGLSIIDEFCPLDKYYFGVFGVLNEPCSLSLFKQKVESVLGHEVRVWQNNNSKVIKVGIVSGSGADLESLHEAVSLGCDTYITGEKKLKTVLYARHTGLNFILGSHTFTEKNGVKAYIELIKGQAKDVKYIELQDEFIE